jgi:hypothetical protein
MRVGTRPPQMHRDFNRAAFTIGFGAARTITRKWNTSAPILCVPVWLRSLKSGFIKVH